MADISKLEEQAEIERLKGWESLLKAESHALIKAEAIKILYEWEAQVIWV